MLRLLSSLSRSLGVYVVGSVVLVKRRLTGGDWVALQRGSEKLQEMPVRFDLVDGAPHWPPG